MWRSLQFTRTRETNEAVNNMDTLSPWPHSVFPDCPFLFFLLATGNTPPYSPHVAKWESQEKAVNLGLHFFPWYLSSVPQRVTVRSGTCRGFISTCRRSSLRSLRCTWQALHHHFCMATPCNVSSSLSIITCHSCFGNYAIFYHQLHTFIFLLCSWLYTRESEPRQQRYLRYYSFGNQCPYTDTWLFSLSKACWTFHLKKAR